MIKNFALKQTLIVLGILLIFGCAEAENPDPTPQNLVSEESSGTESSPTSTRYRSFITAINFKDGQIFSQKTTVQELDFDPSEHLDWNWEDFE